MDILWKYFTSIFYEFTCFGVSWILLDNCLKILVFRMPAVCDKLVQELIHGISWNYTFSKTLTYLRVFMMYVTQTLQFLCCVFYDFRDNSISISMRWYLIKGHFLLESFRRVFVLGFGVYNYTFGTARMCF